MQQWEKESTMSFAPTKSFSIGRGRSVAKDRHTLQTQLGEFTRLGDQGAPANTMYLGWMVGMNQFQADRLSWEKTFAKAEARAQHLSRFT